MKRRDFGLLAGTSLAAAAVARPAHAQSAAPNPELLKTTLTPMGAERAGNADGSIPAWTGGLVSPPLPPTTPVNVRLFEDEQPLYTVTADNMAQYADLLSEGTKAQIQKFGLTLNVYKTHRTAAAPQYVYDNTAKNATRAQLDPRGGRLGFSNAYGGAPFPIINTADPLVGGAQLIWNHLTAWLDYSDYSTFTPGVVMIGGKLILVSGAVARTIYPYYDPNGSLETFGGYYSKGHYYTKAPAGANGQEVLTWHTTNVNNQPDITWTLLNGQGRVRKAPNMAFDAPNPDSDGIANLDESQGFYGNPSQYDWTYIGKKELLIPYNCNNFAFVPAQEFLGPHFPKPEYTRWEKHRVWVLEATLHPGNHNVNAKRRFYLDEDTWYIVQGEGYDANNNMVKHYAVYLSCTPSTPAVGTVATGTFSLTSGDYCFNGTYPYGEYSTSKYLIAQNEAYFEPQQMAAQAAF